MKPMRPVRFVLAVASVLVVSAIAGSLFGRGTASTQERLPDRYRAFTAAVRLVETHYVEKTESDRVVYSAISGMLQTLDPHSSFLDPRTYGQMRERQQGRYYGLGITIQVIDGDITAVSLFEGSPAYKKGVRRGDVIAKIDGEDAKGWTSEQAARRLRGPKGTTVRVSLRRRGYDQLIELDVARDEINIPTIAAAAMIDGTTAYIRLQDFAEQTGNDLSAALEGPVGQGHAPAAARPARQSGRAARPGDPRVERVPPAGADDRLHARADSQLRPGLPRDGAGRVHRPARGGARQPQQRERLGNRERRAPGSRPRGRRRGDDVRQGAGAVGLPDQRGRRPRADDGAVLHAERADDPAALGRRPSTST